MRPIPGPLAVHYLPNRDSCLVWYGSIKRRTRPLLEPHPLLPWLQLHLLYFWLIDQCSGGRRWKWKKPPSGVKMLYQSELLFTAAISVLLNGEYRTLPPDWWVRALFALIRVLFLKCTNGRQWKVIYTKVHTVYTLNDAQLVLKGPKCQQRLSAICRLRALSVAPHLLLPLYKCIVQPVLLLCSPCFFNMLSAPNKNRLTQVTRKAAKIIGLPAPNLSDLNSTATARRGHTIALDPSHPPNP